MPLWDPYQERRPETPKSKPDKKAEENELETSLPPEGEIQEIGQTPPEETLESPALPVEPAPEPPRPFASEAGVKLAETPASPLDLGKVSEAEQVLENPEKFDALTVETATRLLHEIRQRADKATK